jgi:hypothetical protein
LLATEVPHQDRVRYYVYHPTAEKIGPFNVRVESNVRYVYMTPAQAEFHLATYLIGSIPWTSQPYASRKTIYQLTGNVVPPDFPPVVNGKQPHVVTLSTWAAHTHVKHQETRQCKSSC